MIVLKLLKASIQGNRDYQILQFTFRSVLESTLGKKS